MGLLMSSNNSAIELLYQSQYIHLQISFILTQNYIKQSTIKSVYEKKKKLRVSI